MSDKEYISKTIPKIKVYFSRSTNFSKVLFTFEKFCKYELLETISIAGKRTFEKFWT